MSPTAYNLFSNPIFLRYARSRLRPKGLSIALILTLLITGFVFFGFRAVALFRGNLSVVDAERLTLLPVMFLQNLILFFLGTGQVASGMTAEADEGVLEYQRLTPMSPSTKLVGYLFGLPIREYVMVAATLPFTAWSLYHGEVSATAWLPLYGILFSSTLLYHLTGLVAGTVVKNKRWAFLVSIAGVFLLYTAMPQLAKLGLTVFQYFTIFPAIQEHLPNFTPKSLPALSQIENFAESTRFFHWHMSQTAFTLCVQGGLSLTLASVIWRRWKREEYNLMGKIWAVFAIGGAQLLLLGNVIPLIDSGAAFPGQHFKKALLHVEPAHPSLAEASVMIGIYGSATLILILVLTLMITPSRDLQTQGNRRAQKLGHCRPQWWTDAASSFGFVIALIAVGTIGWNLYAQALIESRWFQPRPWPDEGWCIFAMVLCTGALSAHAVLELWGKRAMFLTVLIFGVTPLMIGIILAAANTTTLEGAIYVTAISPFAGPMYASETITAAATGPVVKTVHRAFWIWQPCLCLASMGLMFLLWWGKNRRLA